MVSGVLVGWEVVLLQKDLFAKMPVQFEMNLKEKFHYENEMKMVNPELFLLC